MIDPIERVGEAESPGSDISVEVFRTPDGAYTTWWKVGISVFEIQQENLPALLDLVEGAVGFIREEEETYVG